MATGVKKDIDSARLEQKGDAYQRPLEQIMRGIPVQQRATATLDGKTGADAAEQDLQVTKEGLGSRKRESFSPEHLEAEWQDIQSFSQC